MDRNEYRDDEPDGDVDAPDTYWRRRAITLALGMGLLGILAWGFSGGGARSQVTPIPAAALGTAVPGSPTPGTGTSNTGTSNTGTSSAGTSNGGASAAPGSATPGAQPAPGGQGTASPSPGSGSADVKAGAASGTPKPDQPSGSAAGHQRQAGGAAQAGQGQPGTGQNGAGQSGGGQAGCAPGSVVLSLFTDRASYGAQQFPKFSVYAVSTTSDGCTFSTGQLQVVVLSANRVIWDSTDCAHADPHADHAIALTRGVPVQEQVTWNRDITLPGCQVLAVAQHPGNYEVAARTVSVQSPARYFKLTG